MDDDLYDEFGNYIGGEVDSDDEPVRAPSPQAQPDSDDEEDSMHVEDEEAEQAIVLHEDKKYYPDAEQVFGPDVEVAVHEVDAQQLSEPLIAPVVNKEFAIEEQELPLTTYSREFQANMMGLPEQVRTVALVGHIHHGKTSLADMMIMETHDLKEFERRREDEQLRYLDTHVIERERGVSITASPMSLVLQNLKGKSHLVNVIDTPGHVDFVDQVAIAARLADGLVVVIDVVEGLSINTKQVLRHAVLEEIPFVVVLNKIDRLILDLRLPPDEAHFKLEHLVQDVNDYLAEVSVGGGKTTRVSPDLGNVVFASAMLEFCFSVQSFAKMYCDTDAFSGVDAHELASRLWGNVYYSPETRKFYGKKKRPESQRTFVHFVLDPIYKLFAHSISDNKQALEKVLKQLDITLTPATYKLNARPLLKAVCRLFFGKCSALVEAVVSFVPPPTEGGRFVKHAFTGPADSEPARAIAKCDQDGPLVVQVAKLVSDASGSQFFALARVLSGTLENGSVVRVLGENYTQDDDEDVLEAAVSGLWIPCTRYKIAVDAIPAGNLALIGGIERGVVKTATIYSADWSDEQTHPLVPLKYIAQPVLKVAVEPLNPAELPKMLDGLRKINSTYGVVQTRVEESGEHVVIGSGELYMDCVMHDLRHVYADMEIKVSDPVTKFSETCIDTSAIMAYAETPNKLNKITIIAEPLDEQIAFDIESGAVDINWPVRDLGKHFQDKYKWDAMASRNIWAFGPDDHSPNILSNDTLASEVDQTLLRSVKESIKQGFQWATREGPLCEEPIRNVQFKIIDATLVDDPIKRGGGQVIPTTRRACYSSFLLASPRLLEPVYSFYVTCNAMSMQVVYNLATRRRGAVYRDGPIPGTPLYFVEGVIPVMDSFGFETDLRIASQGKAFPSLVFDKWQIVPGDPLDRDQKTRPLQPAEPSALARDFVLKTRRRKGLSEEPTINKYLDESLVQKMVQAGLLDN